MKIIGIVNGQKVEFEFELFTHMIVCEAASVHGEVMTWVKKMSSVGWTPMTDIIISRRQGQNLFTASFMAHFVGPEKAKKIPIRFVTREPPPCLN